MDYWSFQTPEEANLAYLRAESLRRIAVLCGVLGYLWITLALQPTMQPRTITYTWWGALTLIIVSSLTYALRKHWHLAAPLLVAGCFVAVACMVIVYRDMSLAFLFAVPLIVTSILLGRFFLLLVFALSSLMVMGVDLWYVTPGSLSPALELPLLALSLVALASYVSAYNLVMALAWVWSQFEHSQEVERIAQERGAELRQALKSLDEATYRLERTNQMLSLAYQQAEEARRLKQEFAQTISHELRTPLNLVVGFTEVLVQNPEYYGSRLAPAYTRDLSIVHRNAVHLQNLVNDVLDLARIDTAQMTLTVQEVSPAELASEAIDTVRGLVEAKGLKLHTAIENDLPPLLADPLRIRQVLINLLNNASRFTERGSITVSAQRAGADVLFAVTDTGMGIAPEDISVIFQEFKQLDHVTTRRHDGAGLGLAISRRFVELHGGHIWVESKVGQGSTFFFRLPSEGTSTAAIPLAHWQSSSRKELADANMPALLAVTPSTTAAALLSRYLRGCRTTVVQDLDQARKAAGELLPEIVVIDQASADQEQVDNLMLDWRLPDTLFLRCPLPSETRDRTRTEVDGYLIKPVSQQSLWDTLRRFGDRVDKVLVVDDDPDFVRLLARLLDNPVRRYQVVRAYGGEEALGMMQRHQPDLALIDLRMPSMDGWELAARIRARSDWKHIPIVILSGEDEVDSLEVMHGTIAISKAEGLRPADALHWIQDALETNVRGTRAPLVPAPSISAEAIGGAPDGAS